MTNAIFTIIASVLSIAAALGLDALLGKWVAYFTIVWETKASASARKAAADAVASYKKTSETNFRTWRELRRAWQTKDQEAKDPKELP